MKTLVFVFVVLATIGLMTGTAVTNIQPAHADKIVCSEGSVCVVDKNKFKTKCKENCGNTNFPSGE